MTKDKLNKKLKKYKSDSTDFYCEVIAVDDVKQIIRSFYKDIMPEKNEVTNGDDLMNRGWNNAIDQIKSNAKEWGIK